MSSSTSPDVRRNPMAAQNQTIPHRQAGRLGKGLLGLFIQGHVAVYRRTNGKIGGGEHLLLLTTTGRKSGVFRCTPLFFFRDGEQFIIIAAAAGAAKDPVWWLNLQSHPQAKIQVGSQI